MCKKSSVKISICPICNLPVELSDPDNLCDCGAVLNRNGMVIDDPFTQAAEDQAYIESGIDNFWDPETEKIAEEYMR